MMTTAVPTPELHRRIRRARQDLELARRRADWNRARVAEHTMNCFLDALCERLAPGGIRPRLPH